MDSQIKKSKNGENSYNGGLTMTLQEAIKHCEEKASDCNKCADEHRQLAEWLLELKERRERDETDGHKRAD